MIMPDGSQISATGDIVYKVDKNDIYSFVIYDKAGNSTSFEVKVDEINKSDNVGDVNVDLDDVKKIVQDAEKVRLPNGEWTDSLTLENIKPGTYTIEVMDKDGNVKSVNITITDEQIAKGFWKPSDNNIIWYVLPAAFAFLILFMLFAYNVKITLMGKDEYGGEKTLKTRKNLKQRRDEVIVFLKQKDLSEADYAVITLAKRFTKRMRSRVLVIMINNTEILRKAIPSDAEGRFEVTVGKKKNQ
jgi:hypothetical protein